MLREWKKGDYGWIKYRNNWCRCRINRLITKSKAYITIATKSAGYQEFVRKLELISYYTPKDIVEQNLVRGRLAKFPENGDTPEPEDEPVNDHEPEPEQPKDADIISIIRLVQGHLSGKSEDYILGYIHGVLDSQKFQ